MKNKNLQCFLPKGKQVLAVLLLMLVLVPWNGLRAQYLVNIGTNACPNSVNTFVPFRGAKSDVLQKNEFIIPAAILQNAGMWSGTVHSMSFLLDLPVSHDFNGTYQVFLADMKTQTNHSTGDFVGTGYNSDSYSQYNPLPQVVYTGPLKVFKHEMLIEFTTDFYHDGNANLLVGIYTVTPDTNPTETSFFGVTDDPTCYPSYTYTGLHEDGDMGKSIEGFCPRITFNAGSAPKKLTVTCSPSFVGKESINGGTAGTSVYAYLGQNTTVSLSTTNNTGYSEFYFVGWAVGSPDNPIQSTNTTLDYTFTGASDVTVYAVYDAEYTVTVSSDPTGGAIVTGAGTYHYGESCTVTATPDASCYSFEKWTINGSSSNYNSTYTFTVKSDKDLVANLKPRSYSVSGNSNWATGYGTYKCGETCTLIATPGNCYHFVSWQDNNGNVVSTDPEYSFVVSGYTYIYPQCESNTTPVTAVAGTGVASVQINGCTPGTTVTEQAYDCGYNYVEATLEYAGVGCFVFDGWYDEDDHLLSTDQYFSFYNVENTTLIAKATTTYHNVTLDFDPSLGGTATGEGVFGCGETCTVTATPDNCYHFVNWTNEYDNIVSTDEEYSFPMTWDITLTPHFEINSAQITANASTGVSSVKINNSTPGSTVTETSDECNSITLTATLDGSGCYAFDGWYDENEDFVSNDNPYTLTVSGSASYTAKASLLSYTITSSANPSSAGTTSGGGTFDCGATCTLTATPASGYDFSNWTEGGVFVSSDQSYSFTVTGDRNLVANFITGGTGFNITANVNPSDGGTVSNTGIYSNGDQCTLIATADPCYTFVNWTEGGTVVSTDPSYTFTVTSDRDFVANFSINSYTIYAYASTSSYGTVSGNNGTYQCGETCTLTATPNSNYFFANWTENGVVVSTDFSYSFTVTGNRNLVANFVQGYTLTLIPRLNHNNITTDNSGGSISAYYTWNGSTVTVNSGDKVPQGAVLSLTATPGEQYAFSLWERSGNNYYNNYYGYFTNSSGYTSGYTTDNPATFTIGTTDCTIYANFYLPEYPLYFSSISNIYSYELPTISAYYILDGNTVTVNSGDYVHEGVVVYLTAPTSDCHTFVRWSRTSGNGTFDNGSYTSEDNPTAFTMGNESNSIYAEYSTLVYNITTNTSIGGSVNYPYPTACGSDVTITATPSSCYTFGYWTDDNNNDVVVSTDASYTFTVSGEASYTAHFIPDNTYLLKAVADHGIESVKIGYDGTPGTTATATVAGCEWITFEATTSDHWFDGWYDENDNLVSDNPYYYFEVTGPVTYTAKAKPNLDIYRVGAKSITVVDHSFDYVSGDHYRVHANNGEELTVRATVECPYVFAGWKKLNNTTGEYDIVSTDLEYTFTITECTTLQAVAERYLWTDYVTSDPGPEHFEVDGSGNVTIKSATGLAWLISYVNGFNNVPAHTMEGKTVSLEPSVSSYEINMAENIWVPIGFDENTPFKGTFNGNHHNISGIHIDVRDEEIDVLEERLTALYGTAENPKVLRYSGLFGYTEGASIKNTFMYLGFNGCENSDNDWISCQAEGGYLGMLVAYGKDLDVESCYGAIGLGIMGNVSCAGGLVGCAENASGHHSIKASWANSHFILLGLFGGLAGEDAPHITEAGLLEMNMGGLVGYTNAEVKNCYSISDELLSVMLIGDLLSTYMPYLGAIAGRSDNIEGIQNVYIHPYSQIYKKVVGNSTTASDTWYTIDTVAYNDVTVKFTAPKPNTYCTDDNTVDGVPFAELLNSNMENDPDMDGYKWISPHTVGINRGLPVILKTDAGNNARVFLDLMGTTMNDALWLVIDFVMDYDDMIPYVNALVQTHPELSSMTFNVLVFSNGDLSSSFSSSVNHNIFIGEDVALTQSVNTPITAYTGITLDNYSENNGEENRDWHAFSSPLNAAKIGITYGDQTFDIAGNTYTEELVFNTDYSLVQNDDEVYFPNGIPSGKKFDLYSYYEPEYHFINLKRMSGNHWHTDDVEDLHINYNGGGDDNTNETTFTPGKGYLMAIGDNVVRSTYLQAKGVLNNGTIDGIEVTSLGDNQTGYNFLGNPYQSYLDFVEFADENSHALWSGNDAMGYRAYFVYDADEDGYVEYLADENGNSFSDGAAATVGRYLHPHQGFFVVRNAEGTSSTSTVKFTNDMRSIEGNGVAFRNAHNYPLVNLFCTDSDGKREVSVIELDRPSNAGSLKMKRMLTGMGNMYIHWDNEDFKSMFLDHTPNYVPVWFDAAEDGVFTMSWNTANADFGYMHLIDNMTGADIDCLTNDSYTFEAHVNDMSSRFRLVFNPLGIEEETTTEPAENFAFVNGNELVVNGEGELSLIDLNGRILATEYVSGQQSHITMPKVAVGMYMLRLTSGKETKVQKIVVRK